MTYIQIQKYTFEFSKPPATSEIDEFLGTTTETRMFSG
jgi:hypothetical protein